MATPVNYTIHLRNKSTQIPIEIKKTLHFPIYKTSITLIPKPGRKIIIRKTAD